MQKKERKKKTDRKRKKCTPAKTTHLFPALQGYGICHFKAVNCRREFQIGSAEFLGMLVACPIGQGCLFTCFFSSLYMFFYSGQNKTSCSVAEMGSENHQGSSLCQERLRKAAPSQRQAGKKGHGAERLDCDALNGPFCWASSHALHTSILGFSNTLCKTITENISLILCYWKKKKKRLIHFGSWEECCKPVCMCVSG